MFRSLSTTFRRLPVLANQIKCSRAVHYNPYDNNNNEMIRATTILSVRKGGKVVLIGDGQVSQGESILKHNAKKVRRLGAQRQVIAGLAGSTADALTFYERLEEKMEKYPGQLLRACVDLARDWRRDKMLRQLNAVMIVADEKVSLMLTGNGDVIEPEGRGAVLAIGSGGLVARAAARALIDIDGLDAEEIAKRAMKIAAETCVYTNSTFVMETLEDKQQQT
eukprot:c3523_g1_i1.p1 GENE.c3523_g1_i1~~c3523_g1_i1.p1  ORF type:complete len:233 (-),score=65.89 c3523_g1_i1:100-765(-)